MFWSGSPRLSGKILILAIKPEAKRNNFLSSSQKLQSRLLVGQWSRMRSSGKNNEEKETNCEGTVIVIGVDEEDKD